ncbi:transposase, partial [Paracoccus bogoriensis]|uniref:transposase n=1 Tax=Paracoccus bogoriensis TaxID=242065 RepID=UPI001CA5E6A5
TVHIDASLIRANVSMDALVARHLDAVEAANDAERDARELAGFKTLCRTDPDASCHCCVIGSSSKGDGNVEGLGLRPACKQHIAVDDLEGIVVDVEIVTARNTTRAGSRSASTSSREPSGSPRAGSLPTRSAVRAAPTPPLRTARSMPSFRLFAPPASGCARLSGRTVQVRSSSRCGPLPGEEAADRQKQHKTGKWYRGLPARLRALPSQGTMLAPRRSVPPGAYRREPRGHPASSAKAPGMEQDDQAIYTRHRWRVEGTHGTAKTLHGLAGAIRRGLENMKIQALLTATAMNLKKLAVAVLLFPCSILQRREARPITVPA